jgi:hypothetical protein
MQNAKWKMKDKNGITIHAAFFIFSFCILHFAFCINGWAGY